MIDPMRTVVTLIVPLAYIAFMIFSFVDVLLTPTWRAKGLPKVAWLFLVVLFNPIAGIIWFLAGKERDDSPERRQVAPDDDPEFLARMRMKDDQDERIRRLEQELADLDDDQPDGNGPAPR
jgi:hypothetical protein